MFDFTIPEDLVLLRRSASELARELAAAARRHERSGAVDDAVRDAAHARGLALVEVPESLGGAALGSLAKSIVLSELAGGDAGAALALDGLGPALYPLLELGGERGREVVREQLEDPRVRGWVLIDDDRAFTVDEGRVRGTFPWVPASSLSVLVVVQDGVAHVVTGGITFQPVPPCALHAAGSSEITIDAEIALRFEGDVRAISRTLARLRLYAASCLLGVAEASLRHATAYAKERVAFGRPVAHHQGVAFLIAGLATQLEAARLSSWRAAWAIDGDADPSEPAAQALLDAIDVALEAGEQGVQLLGGHGYMQDHPVEKWMREARTLSVLWGGRDAALELLAARTLGTPGELGAQLSWGSGA